MNEPHSRKKKYSLLVMILALASLLSSLSSFPLLSESLDGAQMPLTHGFFASANPSSLRHHGLSDSATLLLRSASESGISFSNAAEEHSIDGFPSFGNYFTENRGQVNDNVRYYARGNPSIAFMDDGVLLMASEVPEAKALEGFSDLLTSRAIAPTHVRSFAYSIQFENANSVLPVGRGKQSFGSNFLIGNDPSLWKTDVPSYEEVLYPGVYEGIDLVYRMGEGGAKYEFIFEPGSDPEDVEIVYHGIDGLTISLSGDLLVHTPLGELRDSAPYSYQPEGGSVGCRHVLRSHLSSGFECDGVDTSQSLVIDPLVYATFLGGTGSDAGNSLVLDSAGNAYVTGHTTSFDFPATPGAFNTTFDGWSDAFVAKLEADGSALAYATFLGGSAYDSGSSVAVDSNGSVYVMGNTDSLDFPTTPGAFDTSPKKIFMAKLNASGSDLEYSSFLGGSSAQDYGRSMAVDSSGNAYVTGYTGSTDFPTTPNAFDIDYNGAFFDVFVTKFDALGSNLEYSTFLGGNALEGGYSIAVNATGEAYVVGDTMSSDFPSTTGAYDESFNGLYDAFVLRLNAMGSALEYATFLGGTTGSDYGKSVAVDSEGNAYVAGSTRSSDFPTTVGAFDTSFDDEDAFVAKLDASGGDLVFSTFLGGSRWDLGSSVAVGPGGDAYVTGWTGSTDFPTTQGAFDVQLNSTDSFVVVLNLTGSLLEYSTFLGGSDGDWGRSIAVDSSGCAYVTGDTHSPDFPVMLGSFDTEFSGSYDTFIVKLRKGATGYYPPVVESAILTGWAFENVTVAWNASTGESIGVVSRYDIHRGEGFDPAGESYVHVASVSNGTHSFTDVLRGEGDNASYFYLICMVDVVNDSACSHDQAAKTTRPLSPGPNLLSITLVQSSESIETVLQTVEYDKAWFYDSSSQEWKWHMTFKDYRRELWSVNHTMGVWVNVTRDCNLTVAGIVPTQTTIHLHKGWNLVGFPSFNATYTVVDLKVEVGALGVEGYDSTPPYHLRALGEGEMLQAGYGYWVKVEADADWIIEVS